MAQIALSGVIGALSYALDIAEDEPPGPAVRLDRIAEAFARVIDLSDEEFLAIKTHPVHTLRILERAPCFVELADLAANHHEKLDSGAGGTRDHRPRHPGPTRRRGAKRARGARWLHTHTAGAGWAV